MLQFKLIVNRFFRRKCFGFVTAVLAFVNFLSHGIVAKKPGKYCRKNIFRRLPGNQVKLMLETFGAQHLLLILFFKPVNEALRSFFISFAYYQFNAANYCAKYRVYRYGMLIK